VLIVDNMQCLCVGCVLSFPPAISVGIAFGSLRSSSFVKIIEIPVHTLVMVTAFCN
jgi:hypothetical protein